MVSTGIIFYFCDKLLFGKENTNKEALQTGGNGFSVLYLQPHSYKCIKAYSAGYSVVLCRLLF